VADLSPALRRTAETLHPEDARRGVFAGVKPARPIEVHISDDAMVRWLNSPTEERHDREKRIVEGGAIAAAVLLGIAGLIVAFLRYC
jgi:hypothetical protein